MRSENVSIKAQESTPGLYNGDENDIISYGDYEDQMTESTRMPFANCNHYDDAIWVVQLLVWLRMLFPPIHHHQSNDYNSTHLLSSYYMLNTVLRALHGLHHLQKFSEDTVINYNRLKATIHSQRSHT